MSFHLINKQISDADIKRVVLIDSTGTNLGEFSTHVAILTAKDSGLDLVLMSEIGKEPYVCKIMDYSKFSYEKKKKDKENKKSRAEMKELSLKLNTDLNDVDRLVKQAQGFIDRGDYVKITLKLFGRELNFVRQAIDKMNYIKSVITLPVQYKIDFDPVIKQERHNSLIMFIRK